MNSPGAGSRSSSSTLQPRLAQLQKHLSVVAGALDQRVQHPAVLTFDQEQQLMKHALLLHQALDSLCTILQLPQPAATPHPASSHNVESTSNAPNQLAPPSTGPGSTCPPAWAGLPHELLAAILHPHRVGKEARSVCTHFRDAFDAGVSCATLCVPFPTALPRELPHGPPHAPLLTLDAAQLELGRCRGPGNWAGLTRAMQCWPVAAPLQLLLSGNCVDAGGMELLAQALRSPGFAAFGLQVLDLADNPILGGIRHLAAALPASLQLSALRRLRLAGAGLDGEGAAELFAALRAATHMRSLALLDLSRNDLHKLAVPALVACLREAPHVAASLRHLLLGRVGMLSQDACDLAEVVSEHGVRLATLDLSYSMLGNAGAAAWAAALCSCTTLSGLEVLDLARTSVSGSGMVALCSALQVATHLTRLRRLALTPMLGDDVGCAHFAALWAAPQPHVAASLQEVSLSGCDLSCGDMALIGGQLLAPAHLPCLRSLDLSYTAPAGGPIGTPSSMGHICSQLVAATHLTCLRELDLTGVMGVNAFEREDLLDALQRSPHLSGLQHLALGEERVTEPRWLLQLLRRAPHMRGLTRVELRGSVLDAQQGATGCGLSGLRAVLALLPCLRSLAVRRLRGAPAADVMELAAALQGAACVPGLTELRVMWLEGGDARSEAVDTSVVHFCAALSVCTGLSSLCSLEWSLPHELGDATAAWVGDTLGACWHLSGLQELRFWDNAQSLEASHATLKELYGRLAAGHLAGVRVVRV